MPTQQPPPVARPDAPHAIAISLALPRLRRRFKQSVAADPLRSDRPPPLTMSAPCVFSRRPPPPTMSGGIISFPSSSSDSFAAFLPPPPRSSLVLQHPSGVHQHRRRELAWRRAATTCGGIISSPSSSSESSARCAAPILHAPCRRGLPRHTGTLTGQDCLGVRTVPALCHRPHGHGHPSAARRRAALGEEGRLVLP